MVIASWLRERQERKELELRAARMRGRREALEWNRRRMEAAERGEKFTERLPWDEEMPDNEEPKRDTQISVTERLELEDLRIDAARLREQLAIERREHADQIGRLKDIAWRVGRLNAALADVAELGINPQEWAYRLHEPEEETP